jgi:hypothetical protein
MELIGDSIFYVKDEPCSPFPRFTHLILEPPIYARSHSRSSIGAAGVIALNANP